ncbi:MAG: helix-turn-helix domain-containing protein [Halapricum sp.]
MKYLRVEATPDPAATPPFFELIADAPFVTETRLVDWNLGDIDNPTVLFSVTGDIDRFRAQIAETQVLQQWDLTPIDDETFYLYLQVDPPPLLEAVMGVFTMEGLVVVKPLVYRDGSVRARLVAESAVLRTAFESAPEVVDLDIRAIGAYDGGRIDPAASLTDRQRGALEAALDLGYFEQPRSATQADVADRLDCSSSTASEHLRKAQATIVRQAMAWKSSGR